MFSSRKKESEYFSVLVRFIKARITLYLLNCSMNSHQYQCLLPRSLLMTCQRIRTTYCSRLAIIVYHLLERLECSSPQVRTSRLSIALSSITHPKEIKIDSSSSTSTFTLCEGELISNINFTDCLLELKLVEIGLTAKCATEIAE